MTQSEFKGFGRFKPTNRNKRPWQRLKPQAWVLILSGVALFLIGGMTGLNALLFPTYRPLDVVDPTQKPKVTATVDTRAPWAASMTLMKNGFWLPPEPILKAVVDQWGESVREFIVLPPWDWTADKVHKYTIAQALDTAKMVTGPLYEVSIPGNRQISFTGCTGDGWICYLSDGWSDLTVIGYDTASHQPIQSRKIKGMIVY